MKNILLLLFNNLILFFREFSDYCKLIERKTKKKWDLIFYSEGKIYYQYYKSIIDYISANSDIQICYIKIMGKSLDYGIHRLRDKS